VLIETTDLPFTQVAYAAGFSSIRQFNEAVRAVFAETPTSLRSRRTGGAGPSSPGWIALRLARREPFDASGTLDFLGARAIPGVEEPAVGEHGACFRRSLELPHGPAIVELEPVDGHVWCRLRLADVADLGVAVQCSRRLLDLDADPAAIDAVLGADPPLRSSVTERPGVRVPGTPDAAELALRAVVGQQVSVAGARRTLGRIAAAAGVTIEDPVGGVGLRFPPTSWWAEQDPARLPMPGSRSRAAVALARAVVDGELALDQGVDRERTRAALEDIAGIGPWTSAYVAMRALGDPDVWLPGDVGLRRAMSGLGVADGRPERWRPWRSYAVMHLWGLKREPT
jgi:AraC family transcriptional regulator of adaptative response / DNA-3-methyladenine glycosylase II